MSILALAFDMLPIVFEKHFFAAKNFSSFLQDNALAWIAILPDKSE